MQSMISTIRAEFEARGYVQKYTSLGSYPLLYMARDGGVLCASCVEKEALACEPYDDGTIDAQWDVVARDANWEDPSLFCDHCSERIESAYADDDE